MTSNVKTVIQHRRDTNANWLTTTVNLAAGELGYVTTGTYAGMFKIGDGSSAWSALPFAPAGLSATTTAVASGAAGNLVYQTGSSTTGFITGSTAGYLLIGNGTSAPVWTAPTLSVFPTNSSTSSQLAAAISDDTGYVTTGDKLVFNNGPAITSPALTTPTVTSSGMIFKGTGTGTTTLVSGLAGATSYTLTLPAETGTTLLTTATAASTYVPLAGTASAIGALTNVAAVTSSAQVQGATLKAALLTTPGIVTNNSTGVLGSVNYVPVANGGTGGYDTPTARAGLRVYVQAADPTTTGVTPQAGDLWFW